MVACSRPGIFKIREFLYLPPIFLRNLPTLESRTQQGPVGGVMKWEDGFFFNFNFFIYAVGGWVAGGCMFSLFISF